MKLFWKSYSVLFLAIVLGNGLQLLDKNSSIAVYYNTTIIFGSWHIVPYIINVLNALINGIVCIYILGYAFDLKGLSKAPPLLFYARLLSDCFGHSFEMKTVQSGLSQGYLTGFIGLASLVLPILPSYLAQWRMTFSASRLP